MSRNISDNLRKWVKDIAGSHCEYCKLPQNVRLFRFPIDHVIALKHGGKTEKSNLALACLSCNVNKGSDIASIDSLTGKITALFNPRVHKWNEHFELDSLSGRIEGKTPEGRATVRLLQFNSEERIKVRLGLIEVGEFS